MLAELRHLDVPVPVVVMTYYNLVLRAGTKRFARELAAAGVTGAIVPDLPLEESEEWEADAAAEGVGRSCWLRRSLRRRAWSRSAGVPTASFTAST